MGQWPLYFLLTIFSSFNLSTCDITANVGNVGTVLFDKSKANNHCWTNEDYITIKSRKAFQNLLPKIDSSSFQSDQYLADMMSYFDTCVNHVSELSRGTTKHLLLRSLADAMGGYLNSYAVPMTKVSYYAGNVNYHTTEKVYDLLNELKKFLNTNGDGWKESRKVKMPENVSPITVTVLDPATACDQLIYILPQRKRYKRRRSRLKKRKSMLDYVDYEDNNFSRQESLPMFLPYLDNNLRPNSIAVPFRDQNLWSLYDENSASVLNNYYEISVNCISSNKKSQKALVQFNKSFYKWLNESVLPHLNDDKWYPAFGGVLKITAYLKFAVKTKPNTITKTNKEVVTEKPKYIVKVKTNENEPLGTTQLILVAFVSAVFVWILVCVCLLWYRNLRRHSQECSPCSSSESESTPQNESFWEKMKEWWQRKFNKRPCESGRTAVQEESSVCDCCKSRDTVCHVGRRKSYKRRRKKKFKSVYTSESPNTTSSYTRYSIKNYRYSTDISSCSSDSSFR